MNNPDTDRLLRFLDGTLAEPEAARLRADLDGSPALRADLDELRALRGTLRTAVHETADAALQPFFADRLLRRLRPEAAPAMTAEEALFGALWQWFRPVALAGVLLILVLGVYNVQQVADYEAEATTAEAVLALPPVTLSTAYTYDL